MKKGKATRQIAIGLAVLICAIVVAILGFSLTSTTAVLGGIVVFCSLLCPGSLVLLHFLPTGYHPIRNAVSDYVWDDTEFGTGLQSSLWQLRDSLLLQLHLGR